RTARSRRTPHGYPLRQACAVPELRPAKTRMAHVRARRVGARCDRVDEKTPPKDTTAAYGSLPPATGQAPTTAAAVQFGAYPLITRLREAFQGMPFGIYCLHLVAYTTAICAPQRSMATVHRSSRSAM